MEGDTNLFVIETVFQLSKAKVYPGVEQMNMFDGYSASVLCTYKL